MERQDTIKAGNMNRHDTFGAAQGQGQQQLLLAELKRVDTQQEQLKKAVSEAAAEATSRGETLEISPLKSFKMSDSELAQLKSIQLKDQLRRQAEAPAPVRAPAEEATSDGTHAADETLVAVLPVAPAPAPVEAGADREAQMQLLFAELKRIEGQQHQLQTAVAQNRVLVVHPPKGFHADSVEAEYAEEKEVKPDPDRFIPSGGLTGFAVAKDLMKLDFSNFEEAPEEFRAVTFNAPPARKGMRMPSLTALDIQTQGSFGIIEEKGLKLFLQRLQEDQQDMLGLIQAREKARRKGLPEPALPPLKVPPPAVQWDVGQAPSPLVRTAGPPTMFQSSEAQAAVSDPAQSVSPVVSNKPIHKAGRGAGPTPSRFGGASTAAAAPAVATAQPVANPKETRAAPAAFAAAPITAQQAQSSSSLSLQGNTQDTAAAASAAATSSSTQPKAGADAIPTPTPQAAAPTQPQNPTGAPDSPTVHRSAESIVARKPVRAVADATPTPPQAAAPTQPQTPTGPPDSPTVHRSAESIVARKPVRAEADAIPTPTPQAAAPAETPTGAPDSPTVHKSAESIVAREPVRPASKAASRAAVKAALKGRAGEDEDDVQLKPEEMGFAGCSDDAFAALRAQMELAQGKKKNKKKDDKKEEKRKHKEQQSKKASEAEEEKASETEPEEEEEARYAKGNSVFDAPVTNLAAGLQLGFTPSTAGKAKKKNK